MKGKQIANGRTAEIFEWGTAHILKLYLEGFPFNADFEFDLVNTVCAAGINTPAAVELVEVNGRSGIIYERVSGETMLTAIMSNLEQALQFAHKMAELHLAMHQQTATTLPNQKERMQGKIEMADQLTEGEKTAVLHHLAQLPEANHVCHGDFHPDNIMLTPDRPIVIDWIDATQGHPSADIARTKIIMTTGELPDDPIEREHLTQLRQIYYNTYESHYLSRSTLTSEDIAAWILPNAAARLIEGLSPADNHNLLEIVRSGIG